MFSGLVQGTGKIRVLDRQAETINLTVAPTVADVMDQLAIGDSIAINGTCLTVVTMGPDEFQVTLMPQTFEKTTFKDLRVGDLVNLERSLTVGARLEGHIVTGHVDEVVTVRDVQKNENAIEVRFNLPARLTGQVVAQGSVAINGVSLTVMDTSADWFSVGLIPHTQTVTNLDLLAAGSRVNLETDILGKYVVANLQKGAE
ncbi:riboflavin synthase [Limosilactobacillus panis]|uniref:Riboflavin synthase n=1 Tax=Limosilactobacillus panis TaxID=47493 RepID=A0ABT7VPD1_9LACO|nr:riboflavin synthase [Limosilactobacillus panis]MDM8333996.1 riboflavin synthase [Limosilactobacillus panis]HJA21160.1 riboflavin synthase [Candidatus Limosilactobacillus intestinipullorum]